MSLVTSSPTTRDGRAGSPQTAGLCRRPSLPTDAFWFTRWQVELRPARTCRDGREHGARSDAPYLASLSISSGAARFEYFVGFVVAATGFDWKPLASSKSAQASSKSQPAFVGSPSAFDKSQSASAGSPLAFSRSTMASTRRPLAFGRSRWAFAGSWLASGAILVSRPQNGFENS